MSRSDQWTDDYFQPAMEPASLFGNDIGHLPEAAIVPPWEPARVGPPWQDWPAFAASIAAQHAGRDDVCECGACRFVRT